MKAAKTALPPRPLSRKRPSPAKAGPLRGWEVVRSGSDFSWTGGGEGSREAAQPPATVLQGILCRVVRGRGETGAAVAAPEPGRTVRLARSPEKGSSRGGHRPALRGEYEVAIGTGEDNPSHLGRLMGMRIGFGSGGAGAAVTSAHLDGLELLRDSAYFIPHYESSGGSTRSAHPSEGALRAMGVVQGLLLQEEAVEHAADSAGLAPEAPWSRSTP